MSFFAWVSAQHWLTNNLFSFGAYHFSQATLPLLLSSVSKSEHPPTLIFTGATASIKGSAQCASFAAGKFAIRALSQSLAREFGPQGVHVSHVIVDGVIDIPRTKNWDVGNGKPDAKISSAAVSLLFSRAFLEPQLCPIRGSVASNPIAMRKYLDR